MFGGCDCFFIIIRMTMRCLILRFKRLVRENEFLRVSLSLNLFTYAYVIDVADACFILLLCSGKG